MYIDEAHTELDKFRFAAFFFLTRFRTSLETRLRLEDSKLVSLTCEGKFMTNNERLKDTGTM